MPRSSTMNILIADDHVLFRDTLHHYIHRAQPGYKLLMASNLTEVVDILKGKKFVPDLCILDFKMPGMKGHESFESLLKAYPLYSFAVMSGVAEENDIKKILSLGVSGFLPKTLPGRVLLKAIDTMLEGKKFVPYEENGQTLSPCYFADLASSPVKEAEKIKTKIHLTNREEEVLRLLCEGKSNKDIAEVLNLKIVTIKLHIRGIFKKLECNNRTRAVIMARELGIVD